MTQAAVRLRCAVVTSLSPSQPGFLDFAYRVQALAEIHDVTLISNLDLDIPEFQSPGLRRVQLPMSPGQWGWLQFLRQCAAWLHKSRFDKVLLLHSSVAPLALVCRLRRLPVVVYWNEHPTHLAPPCGWRRPATRTVRALVRALMFAGAKAADLVMPIGEAHHQDLLAHGLSPERVALVPMGVATSFQQPVRTASALQGPLQLIYIGTVAVDRGWDVMLGAMAVLAEQPAWRDRAHLTLVGVQPEQMAQCRQQVEALGIAAHVTLIGRVPGHEIPALLQRAHVGLCLWEDLVWYRFNPPTKLFEYLVAGLPVLASRIRTHTAYVQDGRNGVIFDYSAQGLAQAIRGLLQPTTDWPQLNRQAWTSGQPYLWSAIKPHFLKAFAQAGR
jgi:glycosyltransferase involved in cell wall biosynthesis